MKEVVKITTLLLITLGCFSKSKSVCYVQKHQELKLTEPTVIYGGGSVSFNNKFYIDFTWHKTNYSKDTLIYKILRNNTTVFKPKNSVEIILEDGEDRFILNEGENEFRKKTAISYICKKDSMK